MSEFATFYYILIKIKIYYFYILFIVIKIFNLYIIKCYKIYINLININQIN